jgi:hypothetical protein
MISWLSLSISLLALLISGVTLYYSRLKTGKVKMTKPTTIFFGPDGIHMENIKENKIFIRTLLYSTSDKGQYIQNMYARLQRGESIQNFNVWVYGDKDLKRGSGLFVNKEGISSNHHFLLPRNTIYNFSAGDYNLQIFVETVNNRSYKIFEQNLTITASLHDDMIDVQKGLFYDWAPNSQNYEAHLNGTRRKDRKQIDSANFI